MDTGKMGMYIPQNGFLLCCLIAAFRHQQIFYIDIQAGVNRVFLRTLLVHVYTCSINVHMYIVGTNTKLPFSFHRLQYRSQAPLHSHAISFMGVKGHHSRQLHAHGGEPGDKATHYTGPQLTITTKTMVKKTCTCRFMYDLRIYCFIIEWTIYIVEIVIGTYCIYIPQQSIRLQQ